MSSRCTGSKRTQFLHGMVAIVALGLLGGCQKQEVRTLSEFVQARDVTEETKPSAVESGVLARIGSGDVERLRSLVLPVLLVLAPEAARSLASSKALENLRTFSLVVREMAFGLDPKENRARVNQMALVIHATTAKDAKAFEEQLRSWFDGLSLFAHVPTWTCNTDEAKLTCMVSVGEANVGPMGISSDRDGRLPEQGVVLSLVVSVPGLVRKLEGWLGAIALWAVLPEAILGLSSIEFTWFSQGDRLELALAGQNDGVLAAVRASLAEKGRKVMLPESPAMVGMLQVSRLRENTESIRSEWTTKPAFPDWANPASVLDHSPFHRLMELASGNVGFFLPGTLNIADPLGSLVFFFQPTDPTALELRLYQMFPARSHEHVPTRTRTGQYVMRIYMKGKKKVERINWYDKGGTWYFSNRHEALTALDQLLTKPGSEEVGGKGYEIEPGAFLRAEVSPRELIQALELKSRDIGTGMVMTTLKSAAAKWEHRVVVDGLASSDESQTRVVIRATGLTSWLLQALKDFEPLLNFATK